MTLLVFLALVLAQDLQPASEESAAFAQISSEQNSAKKLKLLLDFEKNHPKSNRLAEIHIQLSRTNAAQGDLVKAARYADMAVAAATKLKNQPPPELYPAAAWRTWVASIDASAKSNLAWVKQMVAWQQNAIHSSILRGR